jgi:hypothetical protein
MDGEGDGLRVSREMELLVKEGLEPQARSGTILPPLLDLDRFHHTMQLVQSAHAIRKLYVTILELPLQFSCIRAFCSSPVNPISISQSVSDSDSAFKLSQIFTREASSLPLSHFESSYRSVRATQPSSFPSSEGRPRISSAGQSTCDKNRDLSPRTPGHININPRTPSASCSLASLSCFFAPQRSISGLSERVFALIARLVSTTFIFWCRYPEEAAEAPFLFSLTFTGTDFR